MTGTVPAISQGEVASGTMEGEEKLVGTAERMDGKLDTLIDAAHANGLVLDDIDRNTSAFRKRWMTWTGT